MRIWCQRPTKPLGNSFMALAAFESTNDLGALGVAFERGYDGLDPFILFSKRIILLLQRLGFSLQALDFANHLLLGCLGMHVIMTFILDVSMDTSLASRFPPIALAVTCFSTCADMKV